MRFSKHSFKDRLQKKGYAKSSVESYVRGLELYQQWCKQLANKDKLTEQQLAYKYLIAIKKKYSNHNSINGFITPLKLYCKWYRKNNPFENFTFQTKREFYRHNSFTKQELIAIYKDYPQTTITEIRDKVLLGLYVFQGIKSSEVATIETTDFDMSGYFIQLKGDNGTNTRKIGLDIQQIILLTAYFNKHRKELLKNRTDSALILTSKDRNSTQSIIESLTKKLKKKERNFINFHQLRAAVIRNWIIEYDLRKVQYLCGHKYISSTERYVTENIEHLQAEIEMYFPM